MSQKIDLSLALKELVFLLYVLEVWIQVREETTKRKLHFSEIEHASSENEFAFNLANKIADCVTLQAERQLLEKCFRLEATRES